MYLIVKSIFIKIFLVSLLGLVPAVMQCQVIDSTYMATLKTQLTLDSVQSIKADSIYSISNTALRETDKEVQSLSRKSLPQEEKDVLMKTLTEKKKGIKQDRENALLLILNAEQSKAYFEKIKPSKPAVIHMGINHDRVNCNVCVKN